MRSNPVLEEEAIDVCLDQPRHLFLQTLFECLHSTLLEAIGCWVVGCGCDVFDAVAPCELAKLSAGENGAIVCDEGVRETMCGERSTQWWLEM